LTQAVGGRRHTGTDNPSILISTRDVVPSGRLRVPAPTERQPDKTTCRRVSPEKSSNASACGACGPCAIPRKGIIGRSARSRSRTPCARDNRAAQATLREAPGQSGICRRRSRRSRGWRWTSDGLLLSSRRIGQRRGPMVPERPFLRPSACAVLPGPNGPRPSCLLRSAEHPRQSPASTGPEDA
jgi:hypothetical protein